MSAIQKHTAFNGQGVKASSDTWRTIKGAHYTAWMSCPSASRIAAYRAAGVRCRRFGEELFVHHMDSDEAAAVDRRMGAA